MELLFSGEIPGPDTAAVLAAAVRLGVVTGGSGTH